MKTLPLYHDVRDKLRTGDVLLCSGVDYVAWKIRKVTSSPYSHVAAVRVDLNRVMAFEAAADGTGYLPVSLLARRKYEHIAVYRLRRASAGQFQPYEFLASLLDELGLEYGFATLGLIWFRERLAITVPAKDDATLDTRICSEYVSVAFRRAGIDPCPAKPDKYTYPRDFERSSLFKEVAKFRF